MYERYQNMLNDKKSRLLSPDYSWLNELDKANGFN